MKEIIFTYIFSYLIVVISCITYTLLGFQNLDYFIDYYTNELTEKDRVDIGFCVSNFMYLIRAFANNVTELISTKKCSFIFTDNITNLKMHNLDDWYRKNIQSDSGIWVGNGYTEQMLIKSILFTDCFELIL